MKKNIYIWRISIELFFFLNRFTVDLAPKKEYFIGKSVPFLSKDSNTCFPSSKSSRFLKMFDREPRVTGVKSAAAVRGCSRTAFSLFLTKFSPRIDPKEKQPLNKHILVSIDPAQPSDSASTSLSIPQRLADPG